MALGRWLIWSNEVFRIWWNLWDVSIGNITGEKIIHALVCQWSLLLKFGTFALISLTRSSVGMWCSLWQRKALESICNREGLHCGMLYHVTFNLQADFLSNFKKLMLCSQLTCSTWSFSRNSSYSPDGTLFIVFTSRAGKQSSLQLSLSLAMLFKTNLSPTFCNYNFCF